MLPKWTNKKEKVVQWQRYKLDGRKIYSTHLEGRFSFFNLCASLPPFLLKSEFERQTQNRYATTRADEIHNEDLRKIQKFVEDMSRPPWM